MKALTYSLTPAEHLSNDTNSKYLASILNNNSVRLKKCDIPERSIIYLSIVPNPYIVNERLILLLVWYCCVVSRVGGGTAAASGLRPAAEAETVAQQSGIETDVFQHFSPNKRGVIITLTLDHHWGLAKCKTCDHWICSILVAGLLRETLGNFWHEW